MRTRTKAAWCAVAVSVVACGSRSDLLGVGSGSGRPEGGVPVLTEPPRAPAPPIGVGAMNAGIPPHRRVLRDAGGDPRAKDAALDATAPQPLALPCHLVQIGEPVESMTFDEPRYSFGQAGAIGRRGGMHVVQAGEVEGIRRGVWDDPPLYAVEYDVSVWPPARVHAPAQLFYSMHNPADVLDLPNGNLGLTWWFDGDGLGPTGIKYQTVNSETWAVGVNRFLVENGVAWTHPELTPDGTTLVSAYTTDTDYGSAVHYVLGVFDLEGAPRGEPLPLYSDIPKTPFERRIPTLAVGRSSKELLVAISYLHCAEGSVFCEPRSIVVSRLSSEGGLHLEKVSVIAMPDPSRIATDVALLADGADRVWLTWWEKDAPVDGGTTGSSTLYAAPLAAGGLVAGPTERWHVDSWGVAPRQPSMGPLGAIYPYVKIISSDAGEYGEVHLLHRLVEPNEPVEELTFTTAYTPFPVAPAQFGAPRALVVAYSMYRATDGHGVGLLSKYGCREDAR